MPFSTGDIVLPSVMLNSAAGSATQPAFGVITDEPSAATFDVLWESGRVADAVPAVGLRRVLDATQAEALAGKVFQPCTLRDTAGGLQIAQEAIFFCRGVFRLEDDAASSINVLALLEQLDRNGAFTGRLFPFNGGAPADAVDNLNNGLLLLPGRDWPRY